MPFAGFQSGSPQHFVHFLRMGDVPQYDLWIGWVMPSDDNVPDTEYPLSDALFIINVLQADHFEVLDASGQETLHDYNPFCGDDIIIDDG
jgi:hypothetical protein